MCTQCYHKWYLDPRHPHTERTYAHTFQYNHCQCANASIRLETDGMLQRLCSHGTPLSPVHNSIKEKWFYLHRWKALALNAQCQLGYRVAANQDGSVLGQQIKVNTDSVPVFSSSQVNMYKLIVPKLGGDHLHQGCDGCDRALCDGYVTWGLWLGMFWVHPAQLCLCEAIPCQLVSQTNTCRTVNLIRAVGKQSHHTKWREGPILTSGQRITI